MTNEYIHRPNHGIQVFWGDRGIICTQILTVRDFLFASDVLYDLIHVCRGVVLVGSVSLHMLFIESTHSSCGDAIRDSLVHLWPLSLAIRRKYLQK